MLYFVKRVCLPLRLRKLTATLMANTFGMKRDIHNPDTALETAKGPRH